MVVISQCLSPKVSLKVLLSSCLCFFHLSLFYRFSWLQVTNTAPCEISPYCSWNNCSWPSTVTVSFKYDTEENMLVDKKMHTEIPIWHRRHMTELKGDIVVMNAVVNFTCVWCKDMFNMNRVLLPNWRKNEDVYPFQAAIATTKANGCNTKKKSLGTDKSATSEKRKVSCLCESSLWLLAPILTINHPEKDSFSETSSRWDPQRLRQSPAIVAPSEQHWGLHGFADSNGCSEKQLSDCDLRQRDKRVFNLFRDLL